MHATTMMSFMSRCCCCRTFFVVVHMEEEKQVGSEDDVQYELVALYVLMTCPHSCCCLHGGERGEQLQYRCL